MDLNIRRISSTVHTGEAAPAADTTGMSEIELDRLAAALLERQQRLLDAAGARSLRPDDPAGDLGGWG
jgi:hypothetical protein